MQGKQCYNKLCGITTSRIEQSTNSRPSVIRNLLGEKADAFCEWSEAQQAQCKYPSASEVEVLGDDGEGDSREEDEELGSEEYLLEVGEEVPEESAADLGDEGEIGLLAEGGGGHVVGGATVAVAVAVAHLLADGNAGGASVAFDEADAVTTTSLQSSRVIRSSHCCTVHCCSMR